MKDVLDAYRCDAEGQDVIDEGDDGVDGFSKEGKQKRDR